MRRLTLLTLFICSSGCGGNYATPTTPTPPPAPMSAASAPVVPSNRPATNWKADVVVRAVVHGDGGPCGWGTSRGETRVGVEWNIKIDGAAISVDEDMPNWPTDDIPYKGALSGNEFTVAVDTGPDWLKWVCPANGCRRSEARNR